LLTLPDTVDITRFPNSTSLSEGAALNMNNAAGDAKNIEGDNVEPNDDNMSDAQLDNVSNDVDVSAAVVSAPKKTRKMPKKPSRYKRIGRRYKKHQNKK
jgi:hypothetical protein